MKTFAKLLLAVLLVAACVVAATYLAAAIYFAINKVMPGHLEPGTWLRYWAVYGDDAMQRPRLIMAAVLAAGLVCVPLLFIIGKLHSKPRALHGDARWANDSEVRKAGLL
jgi:type IV secretion system protein VirD4